MKKLGEKINLMGIKLRMKMDNVIKEERGDIGIKQLAITVGIIIIVGAAVLFLKDNIKTIIEDVWKWLFEDVIKKIGQ